MNVDLNESREQSPTEQLLEDSWEARSRRAPIRELAVESAAGIAFVAAAAALSLMTNGLAHVQPGAAVLLIGVYAAVACIEFPIGAGHVVPTQLVLVPMLMVLPPGVVPAFAAMGLVLSALTLWAARRIPGRRVLSAPADAWHAIGPAVVLVLAGSPRIGVSEIPLLAAALAAGCLVDLATTTARSAAMRMGVGWKLQVRVMALVWTVDACLAPLGYLVGTAAQRHVVAVLLVLPLAGLLWMLARDRSERIRQAHQQVEQIRLERSRLQSAVRRLGDAFAAKLELDALFEILLRGSMEALDASAGQLELRDPLARELEAGNTADVACTLAAAQRAAATEQSVHQLERDGNWALVIPFTIAADSHSARGNLRLVRRERAFQDDEKELLGELVAKAQVAAAEILQNDTLRTQALTDALTGLANRRKLANDLSALLDHSDAAEPSLLMLFDLDGFKSYNDTFGHLAGDALLAQLGAKLADAVSSRGEAYRLGGDEFCALVTIDADHLEELIASFARALTDRGKQFDISVSFGAVLIPHEADSPDHALQLADRRMYASKRGRAAGARDQARDVLMQTLQAKQAYLDEHSNKVAMLSVSVARRLGLSGEQLDEIARAAELHDIGKVGIPDSILNKPSPLTPAEWGFINQHTILGERILNAAPALRPVARIVRSSHERWDGTGYPDRLAEEDIPIGARIVAVCDAYEAMTVDRPYRSSLEHEGACGQLRAMAGTQFDARIVGVFLDVISEFDDDLTAGAEVPSPVREVSAHLHSLLKPAI